MKKRKQKNKLVLGAPAVLVLILITVLSNFLFPDSSGKSENSDKNYSDYPFYVSFIDVDQGDCELISCNGVNILIDGGEAKYAGKVLDYLDELGIEKLDCYIATHPHSDHIGAAAQILNTVSCDKVFTTYFSEFNIPTTNIYENFIDAIYDSGAEAVAVDACESYTFGDLKIDILAPMTESENYNDMSIVFTATYKDTTVLFTGDSTTVVEKQMLDEGFNLDADILKVAHHGSTTSSSSAFIDSVSPELAVISCGANNSYGHPHEEILEMLEDKEIEYLRTDLSGTVVCFGDGRTFSVEELK
ncbi:MAG: MBL fold metallo-hydrolase [Clostridia bacterium]|nr:MBL fold metallo-hydrolase [Clostridia bacterium]